MNRTEHSSCLFSSLSLFIHRLYFSNLQSLSSLSSTHSFCIPITLPPFLLPLLPPSGPPFPLLPFLFFSLSPSFLPSLCLLPLTPLLTFPLTLPFTYTPFLPLTLSSLLPFYPPYLLPSLSPSIPHSPYYFLTEWRALIAIFLLESKRSVGLSDIGSRSVHSLTCCHVCSLPCLTYLGPHC